MTDVLDLGSVRLSAGEGRHFELAVHVERLTLGGERYEARPEAVELFSSDATVAGECGRGVRNEDLPR